MQHPIFDLIRRTRRLLDQSIALNERRHPEHKPRPRGRHATPAVAASPSPPSGETRRRYAFRQPWGRPVSGPAKPRMRGGQPGNANAVKHGFSRCAAQRERAEIVAAERALRRDLKALRRDLKAQLPKKVRRGAS